MHLYTKNCEKSIPSFFFFYVAICKDCPQNPCKGVHKTCPAGESLTADKCRCICDCAKRKFNNIIFLCLKARSIDKYDLGLDYQELLTEFFAKI